MRYKTITQIVLFIIALVILFTYIKPALVAIKETQDEIFQYTDASNKAAELNQQLSSLVQTAQSFNQSDIVALEQYLPPTLNDMAIMADITTMVDKSGMRVIELKTGTLVLPEGDAFFEGEKIVSDGTSHLDFELTANGRYNSFKSMLRAFEQNKYQLEIIRMSFGEVVDDNFVATNAVETLEGDYKVQLRAYAYSYNRN